MHRKTYFKYLPLPLLIAAYPILFLFGHNASTLDLSALTFPLGASLLVAGIVYTLFCLLLRKPLHASLSASVFVIFFYLYGSIFHLVTKSNLFPVQPLVLLSLVIILALVLASLVVRIRPSLARGFQRILLIISGALVVYNLFGVTVPTEAQKLLASRPTLTSAEVAATKTAQQKPDIYYIIFDEYSGFDAIRGYWQDSYVDQFETFLQQDGFFVANGSRSLTINTSAEIASRLNLEPFSQNMPDKVKVAAIRDSKVMNLLKSYGYTTVAIDMYFSGIQADQTILYDPKTVVQFTSDEFEKMYLDSTMFNPFSGYLMANNEAAVKQRDMVLYSLDKTVNPGDIRSPKFVYTHILSPHEPFIFDENGNILPPEQSDNWNAYLGQHKYVTKLAEQLVTKLLAKADPTNLPVIILQSDHGARNLPTKTTDGTTTNQLLKKYSLDNAHIILNALYLPGFDTRQLSPSMNPMETFEIVLNHYLGTNLKVNPTYSK